MAIRILGICGSMKPSSSTAAVLRMALRAGASVGAETDFYDISEQPLPFCDGRSDESSYPQEVHTFKKLVKNAHGIIVATPDYHNSFTGGLKNAIDLCGFDEFEHKMVGIIGVSGGAMGAGNAISHLRGVMRGVGAWVVPHQVSISNSGKLFSGPDQLADPMLEKRLLKLGKDVVKYANLFASGLLEEE